MTDDYCRNLSCAIIQQAVDDWRFYIDYVNHFEKYKKMKHPPDYTFDTLREFFQSEWCAFLCETIDPALVLEKLEYERIQAGCM